MKAENIKVSIKDVSEVIEQLEEANKEIDRLKERINKAIEYIENDMPYLEEPSDDYENDHKMIEYNKNILLNILTGGDKD